MDARPGTRLTLINLKLVDYPDIRFWLFISLQVWTGRLLDIYTYSEIDEETWH